MIRPGSRRSEEIWRLRDPDLAQHARIEAARERVGQPVVGCLSQRPMIGWDAGRRRRRGGAARPLQYVLAGRAFLEEPVQIGAPYPAVGRYTPFRSPLDLEERARAHARRLTHVDLVALEVAAPGQPARAHPPRDLLGRQHGRDWQQT